MSTEKVGVILSPGRSRSTATEARRCRKKFLHFFPKGFRDAKYLAWERGYKEHAHLEWQEFLHEAEFRSLLRAGEFTAIASRAVRIESRTNLLFSFEKMALRDAVKSPAGARMFAEGVFQFLHGTGSLEHRFARWCATVEALPRKQTRVLTWPLVTIFGFLAQPKDHIFLKPNVTRIAAREYGHEFEYHSRPNWQTYSALLAFAKKVKNDLEDLHPIDLIDVQSFLWVQGSDEYQE